jgi:hypothetical protein
MIALQARNPQLPDPSRQTAQFANMMNMARQQEAAQLQGERARQEMAYATAKEGREAALQPFAVTKASSEAGGARLKYVMDFFETSEIALANSRNPQQAVALGDRIKQMFPETALQQSIDETLSSIPQDPGQFEAWRKDSLMRTMDAKEQLAQEFTSQNLGTSTRVLRTPKYGGGPAEVVEGSLAAVDIKPTVVNVEGLGPVIVDPNTGKGFPVGAGGVGEYVVPGARGTAGGAPARGNTADVVFGFGEFGSPSKPISQSTIGEVQDFQRNTLIPNTRGKVGAGPGKGTGAVGTYQFTYGTLQEYAPKVLGSNWRNATFTADVQEQLAKAIYEDVKDGDLKKTWAGLPSNRPGQYTNVPWEQVRDQIIQVESGGGRGAAGGGAGAGTGAPQTIQQAAGAADKARTVRQFKEITGFDFTSGKDPVADLIRKSTSGGAEKLGADIVGFIPESMGGGATKGMEAIGALEVIASELTLALLPGNKLGAGVSNEDRKMFEKLVGEMQNPNIPAGKRLAAWGQLKARMGRIFGVAEPKAAAAPAAGARKTETTPTLTPEQVRANPKIKRWKTTDGRVMTRR